jgi:hypothetical protein
MYLETRVSSVAKVGRRPVLRPKPGARSLRGYGRFRGHPDGLRGRANFESDIQGDEGADSESEFGAPDGFEAWRLNEESVAAHRQPDEVVETGLARGGDTDKASVRVCGLDAGAAHSRARCIGNRAVQRGSSHLGLRQAGRGGDEKQNRQTRRESHRTLI